MPRKKTEYKNKYSNEIINVNDINFENDIIEIQPEEVIALQKVVDEQTMNVIDTFNGEILSPSELIQKQKELLAERRRQIQFIMDGKKLEEAMKVMIGMQGITDVFSDMEVMKRVKANTNTAMDLKFLSEAYSKLAEKLSMLQRLDTIDSDGTAKRLNLSLTYKGANGEQVNATINTD